MFNLSTQLLIVSFLKNSFDYLKLFIPLLIVYKIYKKYFTNWNSKNFLSKFLKLFAYGTQVNESTLPLTNLDKNNNEQNEKIEEREESKLTSVKIVEFILCFFGLQASFLVWGLLQERIVKFSYTSENKEKLANFKNSQFLVLSNRFVGLVLSAFILVFFNLSLFRSSRTKCFIFNLNSFRKLTSCKNWAPLFICSYASLSNVLSSWCQYESLKYVSFTSQLLAKSSKSVFVMLTGKIISKKNYKPYEYLCVSIIGLGIFLFSDINKKNLDETNQIITTTLPGFICLLGYLISDSFTSTWQDNLIKTYTMSSISLMFITNLYSCIYTLISLVSQGQLTESFNFVSQHTDVGYHIMLLSIASAIGQIFIFVTIQKFGALVFSLMMTTRQILSIFLSSIVFQHSMSLQSYLGISLIFFALFLQQYLKFKLKPKRIVNF